jgi:hypothetical protein
VYDGYSIVEHGSGSDSVCGMDVSGGDVPAVGTMALHA